MEEQDLNAQLENTEEVSEQSTNETDLKENKKADESEKTSKKKGDKEKKTKKASKKDENEDLNAMSEEELYAHIQTEKLLKRKKTKKIATFSALCVALALALCVIILAAVPVSLKPKCLQDNNLVDITLYGKNASASTLTTANQEQNDQVNLFHKCFDEAFEQSYLSALFSGSLGYYEIDEQTYHRTPSVNDKLASTLMGDSYAGSGNYLVLLNFKDKQILTKQNGGKYDSTWGSPQIWDLQLKFTSAYVVVNKDSGLKDTKIFLVVSYPESSGNVNRLVCVTVKADTSKIYDAWDDLTA